MSFWKAELLRLFEEHEIVRIGPVCQRGIPRVYLTRLMADGEILRVGRGTYVRAHVPLSLDAVLIEIATRMPTAIASHGTAAAYFGLEEYRADRAYVTLPRGYRPPRARPVELRVHTEVDRTHGIGARRVLVRGVEVPVYGPARTVVDFFRHRSRYGVERSIAILAAFRRSTEWDPNELWECASAVRATRDLDLALEVLETVGAVAGDGDAGWGSGNRDLGLSW